MQNTLQDTRGTSPPDYAAEVGRLIASAQHPVPIASGIAAGAAAGYGMYRMQNPTRTTNRRFLMPIVTGAVGGILTHGVVSWIHYTMSGAAMTNENRTGMTDSGLAITQRAAELNAQHGAGTGLRAAAMGMPNDVIISAVAGLGGAIGSGYGIYRWRNPPGQKKQKWVLALVGGIVGGHIAGGLTFALLAARRTANIAAMLGDEAGPLPIADGPLSFSSVAASLTSAGILVGVVGGAKYLYDSYKPRRRRR